MPRSFTSGRGGGSGGTGLLNLNGLTADPQTFATGTSGTDFNISSASSTHTFNLPTASGSNRGLLSTSDWTAFNAKPTISSGAGAPGSTPSKVGDIYIDTTGDNAYIAVGTASSADWAQVDGGGGSPAGSDTQVQFNSSGSFAGDAGFVWDNTSKILTLQNGANANVLRLNSTNANYPPGISFGFNSTNDNGPQIRGDFNGRLYLAAPIGQSVWIGGLQGVDGKLEVQGYAFETGGTATKINTRDAGTVGMTVKLATSQSANAFEVQPQSSTTPLMSIDASGNVSVPDLAYNATTWNGSTLVPTRNAIRDVIETLPFISSGAGAPGSTPSKVGDIYIDTTGDDAYIAVGTASSADWEKSNDGSGSGSPGGSSTQVQYNNGGTFGGVSGVTSDGTNMTFGSANLRATRPRVVTSIDDTNGNEVIAVTATGSAVNEITVANAATGNGPTISATGGDTNVDINIVPKGTGTVNFGSGSAGIIKLTEGTPSGAAASRAVLAANSSGNRLELSNNNGSFSPVVTAASTDTLTNKTLTSPTINSPITTLTAGHGTDDTYTGTVITGLNNSGGVTQWDTVYLNGSSQWVIADANGSGTFPARGLAIATATTGNAVNVLVHGTVRNDAWAWTPGGTIYLSGTAGGLTQTAPSTSGDKVQAVGFALTADIAFFDFNSTYVTVT